MKRFFAFLCCVAALLSMTGCGMLPELLQKKEEPFSFTANLENCTVNNNSEIFFIVPYGTGTFSFENAFSTSKKYTWDIYKDIACAPGSKVISKTVYLNNVVEEVFALFVNTDDSEEMYLYRIHVCQSVGGMKYSTVPNEKGRVYSFYFYEDGTFRHTYNVPGTLELEGTWSQYGGAVTYTWYDSRTQKEKSETFYTNDEGLSFLGESYFMDN